MKDTLLYGVPINTPLIAALHAGPIRLKFQDGELRYLYVGEKEIARRIYFAVRDSRWDTVMPELSDVHINAAEQSFTVTFNAVCKNNIADYRWSGEMTGTPDGKITFHAGGQAAAAFKSPRIGICILYGAESLAGQPYDLIDLADVVTHEAFPRTVTPGVLLTQHARGLRYTAGDGMMVSCMLTGAGFGMEDQRNYCDSSYKAYHSLRYPYPDVPKDLRQCDTLTLEVANARLTPSPAGVHVTIGAPLPGAKMPALLSGEESAKAETFVALNGELAKHQDAPAVSWAFNPAAHMPDDDTFMENLSSVIDQVYTVRAIAPAAKIRIGPINFDSPYPRAGHDPRSQGQFAAAWSAALIGELARAGVNEAVFTLTPGPAQAVLEMMAPYAGEKVLATQITAPGPSPLRALALPGALWLINITDQPQRIILDKLNAATAVRLHEHAQPGTERKLPVHHGTATLTLAPFAVCQLLFSDPLP